jgi:isochorismate synthase
VPGEARFKQAVRQAIANFAHSDIRKAVLSRMLEVELSAPVDGASLFARLSEQNRSGYHFRLPLADGSELIGVSPELLLRKQEGRIYSNPLAGSARRQSDPVRDAQAGNALLASAKDQYEHRLVIDDIARVLAPLCRELNVPAQASLLGTAAMWHLSTPIDGVPADPSASALALACRLHPTPAVCGYPTAQARKLIDLVEPFERGLFTGMVGWSDIDGNGEWAVTIRCGQVHDRRVTLFAGAGIVPDSQPDAEWAETEAKLQTMLQALGMVDAPAVVGAAA